MKALVTSKSLFSLLLVLASFMCFTAQAETAAELNREGRAALEELVRKVSAARALSNNAVAILIFPSIKKAGFVVVGQYGEGILLRNGKTEGYYNTAGASVGFQAGVQEYGYAMFFMKEKALQALNSTEGFEVGVGPSVVVVDQGMAMSKTTMNMQDDIYAFVFGQKGLMAGVGVQGNKITKIQK
jgi:lipid-binding SYLF domain-containing protein